MFSKTVDGSSTEGVSLYDDLYFRRGRPKQQPVCMFDADKSQRIKTQLKSIKCLLTEFVQVLSTLDSSSLDKDSLAELLDLLSSPRETDKILHYVSRKGAGHLDCPEYLVYELSKVDHFRERLEFLRFKHKLQINLFEIDQQLKELNTACDELTNSTGLKDLLGTLLAVGNYLNGGSERGQADGFHIGIVNKLREINDKSGKGNLLEFTMKVYVEQYEKNSELGCPTRFRLPEPSNMRHAAQVSFDDIRRALTELREELLSVREKVNALSLKENSNLSQGLRVTSENFMTSALEVVFEEEKTLINSKAHFVKTTAYFLHDNMQCTPHEFFHIWAEFLHDCKYYWKLAHRNLARHKFELDFGLKSQMSCSSIPGFNSVRSEMLKHLSAVKEDSEPNPMRAQQLKHINNWIESVGKYTQEIKPYKTHHKKESSKKHEPGSHQKTNYDKKSEHKSVVSQSIRSTSPKTITSTPPNVHKPLALNHASPETVENIPLGKDHQKQSRHDQQFQHQNDIQHRHQHQENDNQKQQDIHQHHKQQQPDIHQHYQQQKEIQHHHHQQQQQDHQHHHSRSKAVVNYENQGQSYETPKQLKMSEESSRKPSKPVQPSENEQKKSSQFSLVSWLKRDQGKKTAGDDNTQSATQNQGQGQTSSAKSSGNPFGKFRSSVAQKFSNTASVKRSQDPVDIVQSSKEGRPAVNDREFGLFQQVNDEEPPLETSSPLSTLRKDYRRDYQNCYNYESHNLGEQAYSSAPSTLGSTYSKDYSPVKYELSRSVRQRNDSGIKQQFINQIEAVTETDINNKKGSVKTSPKSRGRDRAPIALGSNMSISEAYGKSDPDLLKHNYENDAPESRNMLSNADTKWVKATAVPVYKAKLIPNYENQMKIDPRLEGGIKGKAEPAISSSHHNENSNTSEEYREMLQRKATSHMHQSSTTSQEYREMLQKTSEVYMAGGYQSVQNIQRQTEEQGSDIRRSRSSQKTAATRRSVSAGNLPDRRSDLLLHAEPSHPAPIYPKHPNSDKKYDAKNTRDKGPVNAQSITSLIERFEKRPEGEEGTKNSEYESQFQNKPLSMTSTPVMHRRNKQQQNQQQQNQQQHQHQQQTNGNISSPEEYRRNVPQSDVMRGSSQHRRQDDYKRQVDYDSSSDGRRHMDAGRSGYQQSGDGQNYNRHSRVSPQQQYDSKTPTSRNSYNCYESHSNYDNVRNDYTTPTSQTSHVFSHSSQNVNYLSQNVPYSSQNTPHLSHSTHNTPYLSQNAPHLSHNSPYSSHNVPNSSNTIHHSIQTSSNFYGGDKSTPSGPPPPKPAHTSMHGGKAPQSENYTEQLRKAFSKSNSVFDRHSKPAPHFGHQGSPGAMAVVKPTIIHQGAVEI